VRGRRKNPWEVLGTAKNVPQRPRGNDKGWTTDQGIQKARKKKQRTGEHGAESEKSTVQTAGGNPKREEPWALGVLSRELYKGGDNHQRPSEKEVEQSVPLHKPKRSLERGEPQN